MKKKTYTKEEITAARLKFRVARKAMREAWKEAVKIVPGYGRRRRHRRSSYYVSKEDLQKRLAMLEKRITKRLDQLGARVKKLRAKR